MRNESPQASHLLFTQFLNDKKPDERALGIALGLAWRKVADYSVFYTDRGWSSGMLAALDSALEEGRPYILRALDGPINLPDPAVDPLFRRFNHVVALLRRLATENDEALMMVLKALRGADIDCARFRISMIDTDFAREIEALICVYEIIHAIDRLRVYLNPKFSSVEECEGHVGATYHLESNRSSL
ncbi:MAG TPA: hypothetical protein VGC77_11085 [Rhodopseudomonas sp.]|uniref:DUF7768 domain-containing protein n=1 Tax=Rhodopseudomonas sp. TaxID=1078 RepID=UPI002ED79A73